MDFLPALFLVLVILLGGAIAVIADNLGRKFGKKRHTLFGLRPKHTATLMTTLAGIGVSAFTVGFVFVASKDVRIWIREGAQAVRTRDTALAEARKATTSLGTARADLKRATALVRDQREETKRLQGEVTDRNTKVGQLDVQLRDGRKEIARLTPLLTKLRGDVGRLESEVGTGRARIRTLDAQLERSRTEVARNVSAANKARKTLTVLQASLKRVTANRAEAIKQNRQAIEENGRLNFELGRLEREIAETKRTIADLEESRRGSEASLLEAQKKLETTQTELNRQEIALVRANNELRQSLTFARQLETTFGRVRQNPITYRIGEEVARIDVPAGLSLGAARGRVDNVLRQARTAAAARGARGGGSFEAAGLLDEIDPKEGRVLRTAAQVREAIAASIADLKAPAILSATSVLNAFESEPVSLTMLVRPNPLVYRDGDTIAEKEVSPRGSIADTLGAIDRFISDEVRKRAERAGMSPVDGALGTVPPERIIELVTSIRSRPLPSVVQAIADGDASAAAPLRLRFRIR